MSEFKFKVYEKVPADDHITFRLMKQHEDPKTTITEDQLKNLRVKEEDNITEKQLESRRTGSSDKITEFNLSKTKGSFGVKHRDETTFTGNINKLEEQRILNKKREDAKYESASATPKKLRWWEVKSPDNLKIAARFSPSDLVMENANDKIVDFGETDFTDTSATNETSNFDIDEDEENNDPAYKTHGELEEEKLEAEENEEDEEHISNITLSFGSVDVGGTPMRMGQVTFDNYNGDKEGTIREVISYVNKEHPDINLSEENIDDSNISDGEIKFAVSESLNEKAASNDFKITVIASKKK